MAHASGSPPRAPPIQYATPLGTRWAKEKASAGSTAAFDLPTDPKTVGPWVLGECIGRGASGRVKIAKHRQTGQLAAVKILPLTPLVSSRHSLDSQQAKCEKQRLGIDREIAMMKLMNHPNIMRIYDVFEGEMELFLVLEYVQGGELFDFLVNKGRLPPGEALEFFKQIIYGLNYAHSFSIIHRDLKPENILIASLKPPLLKIADWGMAAFALPSFELETSCGSPHYASPEIVNGEKYQGTATDIWSCGVILFALLTGRLPFDDKNIRNLLSKVKAGKYDMPNWVDPLAKDLLTKMLVVDAKKRITIPEILSHPWLTTNHPTCDAPDSSVVIPVPPLPPSPSQLALPIPSPEDIDQELLSSLRVIWGKHTDPQGDSLIQELCSPPGYGTHAKAFYFLLGHYREEAIRKRLVDVPDDYQEQPKSTPEGERQIFKTYRPRNLTYPGAQGPLVLLTVGQPSHKEDANQHISSPDGPQPPPVQSRQDEAPTSANQLRQDFIHNSPSASAAPPTRPPPILGNGRGGPRPHPPRRVKAHFSHNAVENINAPSLQFAQNLQNLHDGPSYYHKSNTQRSSINIDIRSRGGTQDVLCPLTAPRNSVVQRPMARTSRYADDQAVDIFSGPTHHHGECFGPVAARRSLPQSLAYKENRRDRVTKHKSKGYHGVDKENQSPLDEGWSYVSSHPDRTSPGRISVARDIGSEVGNLPRTVMRGRKERKKERPPPLNLSPRNSLNIFGSPLETPPAAQSTPSRNSIRPVTSPAVDEFKGWLNNLFNWKPTGQGVFYSVYDISRTRKDISRTLESFGITFESCGYGGLDSGQVEGLRCRLDQGAVDSATGNVWKPVKFRIEFSTGSSDPPLSQENADNLAFFCSSAPPRGRVTSFIGKSTSSSAPLPTSALANSVQLPPGYASAVILVYEKGSTTTFKAIWKRLKELYEDTHVAFRRLSPTLSPTPIAGNIQRLALT